MNLILTFAFCLIGAGETASAHVLLVGQGPDGHPPTTHEFMAGVAIMEHLLKQQPGITVETARGDEPWSDGPSRIDNADGVVLFLTQGARWMRSDPARYAALGRLAKRGGGIVALHWAVGAKDPTFIDTALEFLGGCHGGPDRKYVKQVGEIRVAEPRHPIATAIDPVPVNDEFYYKLKFTRMSPSVTPVLVVPIEGNDETCAWAWERTDKGRSFGFVGLHYHDNWKREDYRRLVTQAILWSLRQPIPENGAPVDSPDSLFVLPAQK